jgi:hypothetical protein
VRGQDAAATLDHLTTRDICKIAPGTAAYLCVLTETGGVADDAIVSNNGGDEWMIAHGSSENMALLLAQGHGVQVTFTDSLHDLSVLGHCLAPSSTQTAILIGQPLAISSTRQPGCSAMTAACRAPAIPANSAMRFLPMLR